MQQGTIDKPAVQAYIAGKHYTDIPDDLFIPPDALEILLDSFSGPFDLLLYLIKKQNINILDIPIISITQQYLHYIQFMEAHRMELAADYLVMAAMLAEIKSRFLLPVLESDDEEDECDPRMELVRRLQAYEQMKTAAEGIDQLPRQERDHFKVCLPADQFEKINIEPEICLSDLFNAYARLLIKEEHQRDHHVDPDVFSVNERMEAILLLLQTKKMMPFNAFFQFKEGRAGLVVTFLAMLELARQALVIIIQTHPFSPILLKVSSDE